MRGEVEKLHSQRDLNGQRLEVLSRLHGLIVEALPDGRNLDGAFLKSRAWVVGPVADQPDFGDCERIVAAASAAAVHELAVASVELGKPTELELVPLESAALVLALRDGHRSLTNLVVVSWPLELLVFKDAADFYLICAETERVEDMLGRSLHDAWTAFEAEAEARAGNSRYFDLRPIARSYRSVGGR